MVSFSAKAQFRVARIGKPHGIRGEVTVEVFTDFPDTRFIKDNEFSLHGTAEQMQRYQKLTVESARWHNKILLLKFAEFSDRNTAESLRNSHLYGEPEESHDDDDAWYADDLIGLTVYNETRDAPSIGEVIDLITGDAQDLLEIRLSDGREVLIPFVEEIVPEIDEEQGAVVITPPPGLLELS